jgi:hypothetical protein
MKAKRLTRTKEKKGETTKPEDHQTRRPPKTSLLYSLERKLRNVSCCQDVHHRLITLVNEKHAHVSICPLSGLWPSPPLSRTSFTGLSTECSSGTQDSHQLQ